MIFPPMRWPKGVPRATSWRSTTTSPPTRSRCLRSWPVRSPPARREAVRPTKATWTRGVPPCVVPVPSPGWFGSPMVAPHLMAGIPVSETPGSRPETRLDGEGHEQVFVGRERHTEVGALADELLPQGLSESGVADDRGQTGHAESVFVVRSREGVHGVAPVPTKILLLGGGNDEAVHRVIGQKRAKRVQARTAVPPDGGEKGQTNAMLIEEGGAPAGQVGSQPAELSPRRHGSASAGSAAERRVLDGGRYPSDIGDVEVGPRRDDLVDPVEDVGAQTELERRKLGFEVLHGARPDDGRRDGRVLEDEAQRQLEQAQPGAVSHHYPGGHRVEHLPVS